MDGVILKKAGFFNYKNRIVYLTQNPSVKKKIYCCNIAQFQKSFVSKLTISYFNVASLKKKFIKNKKIIWDK